jgi:hypothetical protein
MVCKLVAPIWDSQTQTGLTSATENVADGYIVLEIADASPVLPGTFNYYNLYYNTDFSSLFDEPQLVTTENLVSISPAIITLDHYIAARTAQLGVSDQISAPNLTVVGEDLFLFASPTTLAKALDPIDGYVVVDSAVGFPRQDGYVEVGDEVIYYSDVVDGYDGYDGLFIFDRDPFGCNTVVSHMDGYRAAVFKGFEEQNSRGFKARGSCAMPIPTWPEPKGVGVKRVADTGLGTSVDVEWWDAEIPVGFSTEYFNIYQNTNLIDLFRSQPVAFSTALTGTIPGVQPGDSHYFGVRAMYQLEDLATSGFDLLSPNVFSYPDEVTVNETVDGYFFSTELGILFVSSTVGYPSAGFLNIGSEVLQYNSRTSTSFNIIERDLFGLGLEADYATGTPINFFRGIEDGNRNFYRVIPSWDAALQTPKLDLPDGYNNYPTDGYIPGTSYNQDADGYRSVQLDIITEDHSLFEEDNVDFESFPYCGYRTPNFTNLFSRNQCGTYHGGRTMATIAGVNNDQPVEVAGGLDLFESSQGREEVILGVTGEYFVFLRRKTTGKKCPRLSIRSEHPHARCGTCFGTTFLGGYDRYLNGRELKPAEANPNGFIAMRVSPYNNDLELTADRGLAQIDQLEAWTISIPTIKDRDILIRYILDEDTGLYFEEFRYEVLHVNRNKLFFGKNGKQTVTMKRLDKTREQYKLTVALV